MWVCDCATVRLWCGCGVWECTEYGGIRTSLILGGVGWDRMVYDDVWANALNEEDFVQYNTFKTKERVEGDGEKKEKKRKGRGGKIRQLSWVSEWYLIDWYIYNVLSQILLEIMIIIYFFISFLWSSEKGSFPPLFPPSTGNQRTKRGNQKLRWFLHIIIYHSSHRHHPLHCF